MNNTLKDQFCHWVLVMRADRKLTQKDMADALGKTRNGYAKIERGGTNINLVQAEEIAAVFDMHISLNWEHNRNDSQAANLPENNKPRTYIEFDNEFMRRKTKERQDNLKEEMGKQGKKNNGRL